MSDIGNEFQAPLKDLPSTPGLHQAWNKPKPEKLPQPGYWPALMALGIAFFLWGFAVIFNEIIITSFILSGAGLILMIIALVGWIGDLRYERSDKSEQ